MNKRKSIQTEEQLLSALEEFLCDVSEDEPIEEVNAELRTLGYDPDEFGERMQNTAQSALNDSPLNWQNHARNELVKAREKLRKTTKLHTEDFDRSDILNSIHQVLQSLGYGDPSLIPAHFRNFDKASDRDLLSLFNHLEFLASNQDEREE